MTNWDGQTEEIYFGIICQHDRKTFKISSNPFHKEILGIQTTGPQTNN